VESVRLPFQQFENEPERSRPKRYLPPKLPTSRSIGEPLAFEAYEREIGAGYIIHSARFAVRIAEIELDQVPLQMGDAHMLITP